MSERLTEGRLREIESRANAATEGPWSVPHFAKDDAQCNCRYVLCESFMGSVAEISVDNGKRVGEGGNDRPPLEEAKSNAIFIAHSRTDIPALLAEIRALKQERDDLSGELSACKEFPGGCGYWREAARHREQERDEARQSLARFQSEKPELGDLSFRERLRSQMIKEYLGSAPTARIEVNDQERPAPSNLLESQ